MATHGIPGPDGSGVSGLVLPVASLRDLLSSGYFSKIQSGMFIDHPFSFLCI